MEYKKFIHYANKNTTGNKPVEDQLNSFINENDLKKYNYYIEKTLLQGHPAEIIHLSYTKRA